MVMTSVSGHLLGMDFSEQYRRWFSCHPVQLFDLPVEKSCREDSMVKIKKTLEREVRGARMLIVWTDCDRLVLMLVSLLVSVLFIFAGKERTLVWRWSVSAATSTPHCEC